MRTKITARILLVAVLVLLVGSLSVAYAAGPATAQVNWHPQSGSGAVSGAWAQLVRSENGASFNFHATELKPGHVYTVWFVVVNNPDACTMSPCPASEVILNSAAVQSDVTYGAGHVVGKSGRASFAGHVATGELANAWFGNGFNNDAEIHLVLNDHGPMIPELASNMLHSYRGGCTDASLPPIFPATAIADGIPGPNMCRLYQTAIFQQ